MDAHKIPAHSDSNNVNIFSYVYQVFRKYISNTVFKNRDPLIDV